MAVFIYGDPHGTRDIHWLVNFRKHAGAHLTKDDYVAFDIIKYQIIPNCYGKPNKLENIIKKS